MLPRLPGVVVTFTNHSHCSSSSLISTLPLQVPSKCPIYDKNCKWLLSLDIYPCVLVWSLVDRSCSIDCFESYSPPPPPVRTSSVVRAFAPLATIAESSSCISDRFGFDLGHPPWWSLGSRNSPGGRYYIEFRVLVAPLIREGNPIHLFRCFAGSAQFIFALRGCSY